MTTNTIFNLISPYHHSHGIPSHQALEPALDFAAPWIWWLVGDRNRVDVRRRRVDRNSNADLVSVDFEILEKLTDPVRSPSLENPIQGLEPFPRLDRLFIFCGGVVNGFAGL